MVLIAGAFMILAGILKLGRYTRFVSHSVMIGFLTGVAANIIFGQIPDFTGAEAEGRDLRWPRRSMSCSILSSIDMASLLTGLAAVALIVLLGRTPLSSYASIIALVVPDHPGPWCRQHRPGWKTLATIPGGLPIPAFPTSRCPDPTSAGHCRAAIAAIVLVQGAGVAESAPNRDGSASSPIKDFIAQGVGNLASGLFSGLAVGGSVGQTALNVSAGARIRWASIFSGIWMLVILLVFSGVVGLVAMPTLAADPDRRRNRIASHWPDREHPAHRSQLADRHDLHIRRHPVPPDSDRRRHRGGALADAPAEPGSNGPASSGVGAGTGGELYRTACSSFARQPSRDHPQRLRESLLCRCPDSSGPPP